MLLVRIVEYILLIIMLTRISPNEDRERDLLFTKYFLCSTHFIPALQINSKHSQVKLATLPHRAGEEVERKARIRVGKVVGE